MRKAGNQIFTNIRNLGLAAVFVVVNGLTQDVFGDGQGAMLIKLNVSRIFDAHFGRGGDNLGVKVFSQTDQGLHNALDINHHGFNCPGQNGQLLLQEVARRRNTLPH